jgi:hypothetical protein
MLLIHAYPVNLLQPVLLVEYVQDFLQFFLENVNKQYDLTFLAYSLA